MPSCVKVNTRPRRGEIWMCHLNSKDGSVQNGYRPVLILSNNKNNTYSTTLNVVPITSKMNKRKLPVHIELRNYWEYGLKVPSTLMLEQITTINSEHLSKCIGRVTDKETLYNISNAIAIQLSLSVGA